MRRKWLAVCVLFYDLPDTFIMRHEHSMLSAAARGCCKATAFTTPAELNEI